MTLSYFLQRYFVTLIHHAFNRPRCWINVPGLDDTISSPRYAPQPTSSFLSFRTCHLLLREMKLFTLNKLALSFQDELT